jgi:Flp pilus assembly protein TadG
VLAVVRTQIRRMGDWNIGSAAVEFAITAPFLVLLALGIADYGAMVAQSSTLAAHARAGAEYAASQAAQGYFPVSVTAFCPECSNSTASCYCSDNATSLSLCPGLADPAPTTCLAFADKRVLGYVSVTATINPYQPLVAYAGFAPFPSSLSSTTVIRFR